MRSATTFFCLSRLTDEREPPGQSLFGSGSRALGGSFGSFCGCGLRSGLGGSFGLGLLLGDGLCALLVHLGFGSQTGLHGRLGIAGQLVGLGLDLAGLGLQPLVEAGLGLGLREGTLGDTAQQVLLVEYALVGEDSPTGIRGLCAFL